MLLVCLMMAIVFSPEWQASKLQHQASRCA